MSTRSRYTGVTRRCGCIDAEERKRTGRKVKLGKRCPKLRDGRHGECHWRVDLGSGADPKTGVWKEIRRLSGHASTAVEARDARKAAMDAAHEADGISAGGRDRAAAETPTVRDVLEPGMRAKRLKGLANSTLHRYQEILDVHIYPRIGDLPIDCLDEGVLRDQYADILGEKDARLAVKKRPVGQATLIAINRCVRLLLAVAVKSDDLPRNYAANIELAAPRKPKIDIWTGEQIGAFLDAAEEMTRVARSEPKREEHVSLLPAWDLLFDQGMRRGELCGYKWSYVDLETGAVSLPNEPGATLITVGGRAEPSQPKTADSARDGVLAPSTLESLQRHRIRQARWKLAAGSEWKNIDDYILTRPDGTPWHPNHVSGRFRQIAKHAGLSHIPLKNARHSSATHGLASGAETLEEVAERLGHESIQTTRRFYKGETTTRAARASAARATAIPRSSHVSGHPPVHPPEAGVESRTAGTGGGGSA